MQKDANKLVKQTLFGFAVAVTALLLTVLCSFAGLDIGMRASAESEGYYTYTVTDGNATITECDNSISGDVFVPSTLGGYPVTEIGGGAFYNCEGITSVTIPEGIIRIEHWAFFDCANMKSLSIPDSVTMLSYILTGCDQLENIHVGDNNTKYMSQDGVLFTKDQTELIKYPPCKPDTEYSVPDSVKVIKVGAFGDCGSLITVNIPNGVTEIGNGAFANCISLTHVEIPGSVRQIGDDSFRYCDSLISINVSEDNIFYSSQDDVLFTEDQTELIKYPPKKPDTEYTVPDSVKVIRYDAFSDCESLITVNIPNGVTEIGSYAFGNCSSMTHIEIPGSVRRIGINSFEHCDSLISINVSEDNMCYLSQDGVLFHETMDLIKYPPNNPRTEYSIPDNVEFISAKAFYNSVNLKKVTLSKELDTIGGEAFFNCRNLTEIIIPEKVSTIAPRAFGCCMRIENIIIPDSVTFIGYEAFYNCNSLKHIGYTGTQEQWNEIILGSYSSNLTSAQYFHYNFNPDTDITEETVLPTCQAEGIKRTVCSCGYLYDQEQFEIVDCSFTNYVSDNNATCTADGTKTASCDYGCGKTDTVTVTESALGHDWSAWTVTKTETCRNKGEESRACSRCGETEIKYFGAGTHKLVTIPAVEATCTEDGRTKGSYCEVCGEVLEASQVIPAAGHKDDDCDCYCDNCAEEFCGDCDCICHKNTVFSKIIRYFCTLLSKLFRTRISCCYNMIEWNGDLGDIS